MAYQLIREQFIPKPLDDVFAFFQKPENLAVITPPWLNFVILTPSPIQMAHGAQIDYTVRPFGFRLRWTSVISEYDPPRSFVDEQIRGPYKRWHHRHEFLAREGGVLTRDVVDYELYFGILGWVANAVYVRWSLKSIFDYREKMIRQMLG